MHVSAKPDLISVLMGITFALIWSSAFSAAKIALQDAPPLTFLAIRFAIAGFIGIGLAWALGQRLPQSKQAWTAIVFLGICQNALYLGLFFVAMTHVPGGIAAIIASSMPLFVAVVGPFILKETLGIQAVFGLILGFGGVIYIMASHLDGVSGTWTGYAICVVGVVALSTATILVRSVKFGTGLLMVVGLQMLVGGVALAPFAVLFESFEDITPTVSLGLAFLYQTFVPGLIATMIWFALIGRIGATRASVYHFLNPAFGVFIAYLVLSEPFGIPDMIGVAVVTLGILCVQLSKT